MRRAAGRHLLQWSDCLHTSKTNLPGAEQHFTQEAELQSAHSSSRKDIV